MAASGLPNAKTLVPLRHSVPLQKPSRCFRRVAAGNKPVCAFAYLRAFARNHPQIANRLLIFPTPSLSRVSAVPFLQKIPAKKLIATQFEVNLMKIKRPKTRTKQWQ